MGPFFSLFPSWVNIITLAFYPDELTMIMHHNVLNQWSTLFLWTHSPPLGCFTLYREFLDYKRERERERLLKERRERLEKLRRKWRAWAKSLSLEFLWILSHMRPKNCQVNQLLFLNQAVHFLMPIHVALLIPNIVIIISFSFSSTSTRSKMYINKIIVMQIRRILFFVGWQNWAREQTIMCKASENIVHISSDRTNLQNFY